MRAWIQALRLHQWAKNVLIFVPIVIGQAYSDQNRLLITLAGFVLLCAVASAAYIVNDIVDVDADRAHPTKRERPFARGDLSARTGIAVAVVLIAGALLIAFALSRPFALVLAAYLVGTLSYSFYLKRIPLLDVFTIGLLFTARILMGSVIVSLEQSAWLLSFAMFFFFSLALAKRHAEIVAVDRRGVAEVPGRGYRAGDWPLTLVFGVGAGIASVVIMLLYVANDAAPSNFYHDIGWLYVAPAAISLWLMRIWLLSHRAELDDDPVVFALRDRASWLLGLIVAGAMLLAL